MKSKLSKIRKEGEKVLSAKKPDLNAAADALARLAVGNKDVAIKQLGSLFPMFEGLSEKSSQEYNQIFGDTYKAFLKALKDISNSI